ncbi:MAG: hypothetical protein KAI66_09520 [Lentisphaeria bacterium]|nr:hypothetical protein [Lentisphaeria bacterium]
MKRIAACVAILAAALQLPASADTIQIGEKTREGLFQGYAKGRFVFHPFDGKPLKAKQQTVERLTLDKPLQAKLKRRSSGKSTVIELHGYRKGKLHFAVGGKKRAERISGVSTVQVENKMSMQEYMTRAEKQREDKDEEAVEDCDPAAKLTPKKVNIIHFHDPESPSSVRQGGYAARLAEDSRGKVVFRQILAPPGSNAAKTNKLATLPQFWFYSRKGKLVAKLTERYTPEDFKKAIKKSLRRK